MHGLLDGKLSLKVDVPPELLQAPDPYDPAKRPAGIALHDASLYHGRYYIYYGVVPAVVALLPFRLLTGIDLPVPIAVFAFALAGLALALVILAELRRRFFPACGQVMAFILALGFGFACCAPILVRRSSMYELPITCGSFFALAALGCFYLGLRQESRRTLWLAWSSLAWGLAIGSRPTYLVAPLGLLAGFPILFRRADNSRVRGAGAVRLWLAAVVPLAIVGGLLAAYNYARFGSPTEFGVSYILSGVYESKIEHFRLRYAPWNLYAYFFAPAGWGRYFPFFHPLPIDLPKPREHYGMDYAFGLLTNVPLLWLLAFAAAELRYRVDPGRRVLHAIVGAAAWAGVSTAAFFLCFYAAMTRYLGDFASMLALVATVGGLLVIERAANCGGVWRRRGASAVVAGLAAVSVFVVGVVSMDIYSRLLGFNPGTYAALARVANAPVHALERVVGSPTGAMVLCVRFPSHVEAGARQELFRTGWGNQVDRVLVGYPDDAHVVLAYEHAGAPAFDSVPRSVDRSKEHEIAIAMGSLAPPATWPGYKGWAPPQAAFARRHLEVVLDGATELDRRQRFYDSTPANFAIGGRGTPAVFTGRVDGIARAPLVAAPLSVADALASVPLPPDGVWHLTVTFPESDEGSRQPLLVSGETGRADFVVAEFLGHDRLRLLLDHWGSGGKFSEPIDYDPKHAYQLEISHPAYVPANGDKPTSAQELEVSLDGRPIWRVQATLYPGKGEDVFIGANPLGGSSCGEKFAGEIRLEPAAR